MESWPKADENNIIRFWTESAYDYTMTIMDGTYHVFSEHGYAYSFFIKNQNQVFYQQVKPSYEKKMIRAVRKQKKPAAVKPAWSEKVPARPVYQQGHIMIWSDGTKTLNR